MAFYGYGQLGVFFMAQMCTKIKNRHGTCRLALERGKHIPKSGTQPVAEVTGSTGIPAVTSLKIEAKLWPKFSKFHEGSAVAGFAVYLVSVLVRFCPQIWH